MQPTPNTRPGRPPGVTGIRAACARHVQEAIAALSAVASDNTAPPSDRVTAAKTLLEHATERSAA